VEEAFELLAESQPTTVQ